MKNLTSYANKLLLAILIIVGAGAISSQFNRAQAMMFTNCPNEQGALGAYPCYGTKSIAFDHYECQLGTLTDGTGSGCCQYTWKKWYCVVNGASTYIGTKGILTSGAPYGSCHITSTDPFNEVCKADNGNPPNYN